MQRCFMYKKKMLDFVMTCVYNINVHIVSIKGREFMTPKSYITLCIAAILFVIMSAVAIISPHGTYALDNVNTDKSSSAQSSESVSAADDEIALIFTNSDGIEVKLPLNNMSIFASAQITVDEEGKQASFTAIRFKSLMEWSGINPKSDMLVIKGNNNTIAACRLVDLQKEDNAYLIYADEKGNPLNKEEYGCFCLYVADGAKHGLFKDISTIDFG